VNGKPEEAHRISTDGTVGGEGGGEGGGDESKERRRNLESFR